MLRCVLVVSFDRGWVWVFWVVVWVVDCVWVFLCEFGLCCVFLLLVDCVFACGVWVFAVYFVCVFAFGLGGC